MQKSVSPCIVPVGHSHRFRTLHIIFAYLLVCNCFQQASSLSSALNEDQDAIPDGDRLARHLLAKDNNPLSKVGTMLTSLYGAYQNVDRATDFGIIKVNEDRVVIDAVAANDDTRALVQELNSYGFVESASFGRIVSGSISVLALPGICNCETLKFAKPVLRKHNAGSATSQGTTALEADIAMELFGLDGENITVGVLSGTYDCLGGAAVDIASGDLPPADMIQILDDSQCSAEDPLDEGRAMMQIIHDVAPKAMLAFHTAYAGTADFAQGIIELAVQAHARVIVDDIVYRDEPMFQDSIIAQAIDFVSNMGISYFSAAGNDFENSWESGSTGFVDSGTLSPLNGAPQHDFDPTDGVAPRQTIRIYRRNDPFVIVVLQWDEPFFSVSGPPGAQSDIDAYLFLNGTTRVSEGGEDYNVGNDALEFLVVDTAALFEAISPDLEFVDLELEITLVSGPAPTFMKYVISGEALIVDFSTRSGSSYGHANAAGGAGVGAANFLNTPRFGVSPPEIEDYSSSGGCPILFDTQGNRLAAPEIRQQPLVVGPDFVFTSFFPPFPGVPKNFIGTSAAAPHVAAVAALLLQQNNKLTATEVYSILSSTAIDMDDPATVGFDVGFDFRTGFGLVNATAAIATIATPLIAPILTPTKTVHYSATIKSGMKIGKKTKSTRQVTTIGKEAKKGGKEAKKR